MPRHKVIIIGAGASGLAAASRLSAAGMTDVLILEASSRVGGRIYSTDFGQHGSVELGAQWIHGLKGNAAYDMASELGLLDPPTGDEALQLGDTFIYETGEVWEAADMREQWHWIKQAEEEEINHKNEKGESVGDYYNNVLDKRSLGKSKEFIHRLDILKDFFNRYYQHEDGFDDWSVGSFQGSVHQYEFCEEGSEMTTFNKESKFSDLVTHMKEKLLRLGVTVRMDSEVDKICWSEEGAKVALKEGEEEYEAEYVIVTCSLGYLKKHHETLFSPNMPSSKLQTIRTLGFGTVNKVYLRFESIWWAADTEGFAFLYSTENPISDHWTRSVMGLYPVRHQANVMVMWVVGRGARDMEGVPKWKIREDVNELMNKFFKPEIFPGRAEPTEIKATRWGSNPHVLGSYSYLHTDAAEVDIGPKDLAVPMGRVFFAGEATDENHFSTVHGAMEAGWREADRVIDNLV